MSRSKRNTYLALMVVKNICKGMQRTDAEAKATRKHEDLLHPNSRASIKRILAKIEAEMPAYKIQTASDSRFMRAAADKLHTMWKDDEIIPRPAFVAVALNLVVDHKAALPQNATKAIALFDSLEGMLATLYSHMDPDNEAIDDMNHGEKLAREYAQIAFAA